MVVGFYICVHLAYNIYSCVKDLKNKVLRPKYLKLVRYLKKKQVCCYKNLMQDKAT
jgi:hypothetical protein